tara:strand:- start:476 stop:961 length:486 start_codon:yes stop_codon:yes gene_type:complete
MITYEEAHELFEYLPTGQLVRKVTRSNNSKKGQIVGCLTPNKYLVVRINKKLTGVHRLIYFMHTKEWAKEVDHIDGNPSNNKIENLRSCSHKENIRNSPNFSHNTSGVKGVSWQPDRKKWYAYIMVDRKQINLGRHDKFEDAKEAAINARKQAFGEFYRPL